MGVSPLALSIGSSESRTLQLINGRDALGNRIPMDLNDATVTFMGANRMEEGATIHFSVTPTITDADSGIVQLDIPSTATGGLTEGFYAQVWKIVYDADPTNPVYRRGPLYLSGGAVDTGAPTPPLTQVVEFELTTTDPTIALNRSFAGASNVTIRGYARVQTAETDLLLRLTWTDAAGAQTHDFVDGPLPIGNFSFEKTIAVAASSTVTLTATAGTANNIFISGGIY
jgi:hypothetical protein